MTNRQVAAWSIAYLVGFMVFLGVLTQCNGQIAILDSSSHSYNFYPTIHPGTTYVWSEWAHWKIPDQSDSMYFSIEYNRTSIDTTGFAGHNDIFMIGDSLYFKTRAGEYINIVEILREKQ